MSKALIVTEGPDDLRALTEILKRQFGLEVQGGATRDLASHAG